MTENYWAEVGLLHAFAQELVALSNISGSSPAAESLGTALISFSFSPSRFQVLLSLIFEQKQIFDYFKKMDSPIEYELNSKDCSIRSRNFEYSNTSNIFPSLE